MNNTSEEEYFKIFFETIIKDGSFSELEFFSNLHSKHFKPYLTSVLEAISSKKDNIQKAKFLILKSIELCNEDMKKNTIALYCGVLAGNEHFVLLKFLKDNYDIPLPLLKKYHIEQLKLLDNVEAF